MILALLSLASAADVFPSAFNPSAVPFDEGQRAQVELDAAAYRGNGSFFSTWRSDDVVGGVRAAVDATETVRLTAGVHYWRNTHKSGGSTEVTHTPTATVGASFQWLATETVSSRAFVRVGTFAQLGAAVSWRPKGDRWALDAAWGPGIALAPQADTSASGQPALVTVIPELGWSWFIKPGGNSAIRVGLTSVAPTVTARAGTRHAYIEATLMPWVPALFETGAGGQIAVGVVL